MKTLRIFIAFVCVIFVLGCTVKASYQQKPYSEPEKVKVEISNNSVLLEQWYDAYTHEKVSIYSWKRDDHSYLVFLMDGTDSGAMQVLEVK